MTRALIASACVLTCAFAPLATGAAEPPTTVISDADLPLHLKRQQNDAGRLYRHVHRREWAGAAAGYIEAARTSSSAVVGHKSRPTPEKTSGGSVWDQLAQCESGGDWGIATGNGFYGGLQFTVQSWQAVGGSGMPNQASREEQISRGQALQAQQGWGAWPACSRRLGLG